MNLIRIATRKSQLALWQANFVKSRLEARGHGVELVLIETQGDKDYQPFALMQGQGFFTKAVQDAILAGEADVAVHSHKDLPSAPMPMLEIAAVTERADPRDVLLVRPEQFDAQRAKPARSRRRRDRRHERGAAAKTAARLAPRPRHERTPWQRADAGTETA